MPSKKYRKTNRTKRVTTLDTRSPMEIYKSLPPLIYEPLRNPVIGHNARMNWTEGDNNIKILERVMEVEMKDVDITYLETLRLWVKESGIIQNKITFEKKDKQNIKGELLKERCQRVVELAEMETLYKRQQEVEVLLSKMSRLTGGFL